MATSKGTGRSTKRPSPKKSPGRKWCGYSKGEEPPPFRWTAVYLEENGGVRGYVEELRGTTAWAPTIEECCEKLIAEARVTIAANRWETWHSFRDAKVACVKPIIVEIPDDSQV